MNLHARTGRNSGKLNLSKSETTMHAVPNIEIKIK